MAIKVPDVGERALLDQLLDAAGYEVHLYQNDYTPVDATVIGDLDEADYSGYAEQIATGWTAAVTTPLGRAISFADEMNFAHDGGGTDNTIYGYYVLAPTGSLAWVERFLGPITMADASDAFDLIPVLTLRSEF